MRGRQERVVVQEKEDDGAAPRRRTSRRAMKVPLTVDPTHKCTTTASVQISSNGPPSPSHPMPSNPSIARRTHLVLVLLAELAEGQEAVVHCEGLPRVQRLEDARCGPWGVMGGALVVVVVCDSDGGGWGWMVCVRGGGLCGVWDAGAFIGMRSST